MGGPLATSQKYDLCSSDFRATTHETYARMRDRDPVLRQPGLDGETPIWFALRLERDDVKHVGFGRGSLAAAWWRPIPIFRSLASLPVAWN